MRITKTLASAAIIVALAGIGCKRTPAAPPAVPAPAPAAAPAPARPPAPTNAPANVPAPAPTTTPTAPAPSEPAATSGVRGLTTTVTIDDTWKTYTNAALNFTFQWPSRGRYAPEWEVKFVPKGDARIKDGCYAEGAEQARSPERVSVGGVEFCRSSYTEGAAGTYHYSDFYTTKNDSQYIVVSFTKTGYSGGALGCDFDVSTSSSACIDFNVSDYYSLLDQIISTFRYKE